MNQQVLFTHPKYALPPIIGRLIRSRRARATAVDMLIVVVAYNLAVSSRHAILTGSFITWDHWTLGFALFLGLALAVHIGANWLSGNYNTINPYIGLPYGIRLTWTGLAATCVVVGATFLWPFAMDGSAHLVPMSVAIVGGLAVTAGTLSIRFGRRAMYESGHRAKEDAERVVLIGAGSAAEMLIRDIQRNPAAGLTVVGLLDDDPALKGVSIHGPRVLGKVDDVVRIAKERRATKVIVAIPSASGDDLSRIHRLCKPAGLPINTLPSLSELVSRRRVTLGDTRELALTDLLGRPAVHTDQMAISEFIHGQTVLVTGAGGSIGSELCCQIAECRPRRLLLVDHDESALYELHEKLRKIGFTRYEICPWSILHTNRMNALFEEHKPDLVFHAGAYKHVPLMEIAPDQAVLNNIKGTMVLSDLAGRHGARRLVYISTDKAVEPISVMGATKRAGELIMRNMSRSYPDTHFATVRFGNVLGSQGSVIPIFKRQIEGGGPLFITHPDMRRYFMLIGEAVQLVLQAAFLCEEQVSPEFRNLNTFILEMGEPVSIVDVAQRMLDFYWKDPNTSIGVEFSGLRSGEKLDEALTWPLEQVTVTSHPLIKRVCAPIDSGWFYEETSRFDKRVRGLMDLAAGCPDSDTMLQALETCVPGFHRFNGNGGGQKRPTIVVHAERPEENVCVPQL